MKPKVVVVVGARPQFVKHGAVSRHLRDLVTEVLVHTGQHYDHNMSDTFFQQLDLSQPAYNLAVGSGSHAVQTAAVLQATETVLRAEKPDMLLVYGDTNSTLAAALAAVKLHIPIAHVEAGVRNFDLSIPEEVNRVLTDRISDMLFCPTETAVENLRTEGLVKHVHMTGDVMFDLYLEEEQRASHIAPLRLAELGLTGEYLLVTLHRPSNVDDPGRLMSILRTVRATKRQVVFPVHPRTRNILTNAGLLDSVSRWPEFRLLEPLDYLSFLAVGKNALGIVTDSGGVQKEAYFMGVPCTTVFDNTPWPETLEFGWNALTEGDLGLLQESIVRPRPQRARGKAFGDGTAGLQTARLMASYLSIGC